jgi:hypothetical protein
LLKDNRADLYQDEARRLLIALVGFAAVVGLAAPAQADPDGDFLAGLNNAGITYKSRPDAVGIGRRACDLMDQGNPEAEVVKSITQENPGFTSDAATKFTRIAENSYCPQHIWGDAARPTPDNPATAPWFPMLPLPAAS